MLPKETKSAINATWRRWYGRNRSKCIAKNSAWQQHNKKKANEIARLYRYRKQGLSLPAKAPIRCEGCNVHRSKERRHLCLDHDHKTGKTRGWLCDRCNRVLGLCKDKPRVLKGLTSYLRRHHVK